MFYELLTIERENILNRINEYIDNNEDKKAFNEELKKIFSINRVLGSLLIHYTINSLLMFEDEYSNAIKTDAKIVSEIINSFNIRTGEKIYSYQFNTINREDKKKMICTLSIERKDKQEELYAYRMKEIFSKFTELSGDVNEVFYQTIINIIDETYKYAEHYIENVQEGNIEFDENKFIGELIWTLVSTEANEVLRQFNEINKK